MFLPFTNKDSIIKNITLKLTCLINDFLGFWASYIAFESRTITILKMPFFCYGILNHT